MKQSLSPNGRTVSVENDVGETIGYLRPVSGGWFPLDDRSDVLPGFSRAVDKRTARAAVEQVWLGDVMIGQPVQSSKALVFTTVQSSFIQAIAYDKARKRATVRLTNGRVFNYSGIDEATMKAWLSAPSKGKFYNRVIRTAKAA
jgi:hypothetical protein